MSHVLKSKVIHNGVTYENGTEISSDDNAFKALVALGVAVPVSEFVVAKASGPIPALPLSPGESEQQPAELPKPKSKK